MVKDIKKKKSLSELTLKFIDYIFTNNFIGLTQSNFLDLRKISLELDIKKRRLYDLTNIFEGVGYLKKYKKNILEITPTLKKQIILLKQNRVRYQNPDEKNKNRIFIIEKQNNFKETNQKDFEKDNQNDIDYIYQKDFEEAYKRVFN